jgi:hypothetical protein
MFLLSSDLRPLLLLSSVLCPLSSVFLVFSGPFEYDCFGFLAPASIAVKDLETGYIQEF